MSVQNAVKTVFISDIGCPVDDQLSTGGEIEHGLIVDQCDADSIGVRDTHSCSSGIRGTQRL